MRSLILPFALSIAMAHQAMALSYWIDNQSCAGHKAMDKATQETISMGDRASKRLKSASDTDFQHVYEYLMKRPKSDAAEFKTIEGFLSDVGGMTLTTNRNSANIRIYCDQDKRWKARVDPKTKQPTGGFEDPDNWILYDEDPQGCLDLDDQGDLFTLAQTYDEEMPGNAQQPQEKVRATITMCELSFFEDSDPAKPRKEMLLQDIPKSKNLADHAVFNIDMTINQLSLILLHEISHVPPYNTIDNAYYWVDAGPDDKSILEIDAKELMVNADVRSYIGQMALLADRGFTLQREPPANANQADKDEYDNNKKKGHLFMYSNLTKRTIQRRMARLARRYKKA